MTDTKGKNGLVVLLVALGLTLGIGILIGVPFALVAVQSGIRDALVSLVVIVCASAIGVAAGRSRLHRH